MKQEETIELWKKCEVARKAELDSGKCEDDAHLAASAIWNEWAAEVLVEKTKLIDAGKWDAQRIRTGNWQAGNDKTRKWLADAEVDFSDLHFVQETAETSESNDGKALQSVGEAARLDGWIFPGKTRFNGTHFRNKVRFDGARFADMCFFNKAHFHDTVWFGRAEFSGDARFDWAWFYGKARFGKAEFHGEARFDKTAFWSSKKIPDFNECVFKGSAIFEGSRFRDRALFEAIRSEFRFDLSGAEFRALPSFIQANFQEPPCFDDLTLITPLVKSEPKKA